MACLLGFSSTLSTTALIGGLRYNPTTSAALGANSLVGAHTPTAPPLQIDPFATQNTPDGVNAGVEFLRHRRPIPVGHAGRRFLLQQGQHPVAKRGVIFRSEEHTSELQSRFDLVCRLLLEKKK